MEAQTPLGDGVEVTRREGERGVDRRERLLGAAARLEHLGDAHEPGGFRRRFRRNRRLRHLRRMHERLRRRQLCRLVTGRGGRRVTAGVLLVVVVLDVRRVVVRVVVQPRALMLGEVVLAEIFARSLVLLVGGRARRVHAARGRVGETRG